MIKAEIYNYQSHKSTILDFVSGVNVIIGLSDSGKSVIFRAISWPCFNRPLGDEFRSYWGDDTRVILHTSEGDIVERIRTSSVNEYAVNGKSLRAFGTDVPLEVLEALRIDQAQVQAQMDSPFLLSLSPGEASRLLNKAASIDAIDHTIVNLKRSFSKIGEDVKRDEDQLLRYEKQMVAYRDIPLLEKRLKKLEQREKEFKERAVSLEFLEELVDAIDGVEEKLQATEHILGLIERSKGVEGRYNIWKERKENLIDLFGCIKRIKEVQEALAETEKIDYLMSLLIKVEKRFKEWKAINDRLKKVDQLVLKGQRVNTFLDKLKKEQEKLQKKYDELMPDVCPLCGRSG